MTDSAGHGRRHGWNTGSESCTGQLAGLLLEIYFPNILHKNSMRIFTTASNKLQKKKKAQKSTLERNILIIDVF